MLRLERAVTRLEQMSVTMQASNSVAHGNCVNGVDGGKCVLKNCFEAEQNTDSRTEKMDSTLFASALFLSQISRLLCVSRSVPVCGGLRLTAERSSVRLPELQPRYRKRGGKACKCR